MRAPVTIRHAFTYRRDGVPDAYIQRVELSVADANSEHRERRVVLNGDQAHGSWRWLINGTLEISFNARHWKPPRTKVFEWRDSHWRSIEAEEDLIWQVTLLPCDAARDTPAVSATRGNR